uniref:Fatty acid hydroxylase domain-containing protein n=1 Tax=Romanomermis culicivorax TaxID=13658 RepID=A0A915KCI2_ROMCU
MKLKTSNFINNFDFYGFRRMFYLVLPSETTAPTIEETFNYVDEATIWFFIFIIFEFIYDRLKTHGNDRRLCVISDTVTSLTAGLLNITIKATVRYFDLKLWFWLYHNYRLVDLPYDSTFTWLAALIGVDFLYYWFHRTLHEINFLWALHQIHHNSEYFNFSTALRQGMIQQFTGTIFYSSLAFFIPPQLIFVHIALNLVYQFVIHTQIIPKLGVLEYILNTPSHHRVHHARNAYCIDKNYGGLLICWDKIFGTFEAERPDEILEYGVTSYRLNTFDAIYCQVYCLEVLWKKVAASRGLIKKLKALVYGPDWTHDDSEVTKPKIELKRDCQQFDTKAPLILQIYVTLQYAVGSYIYSILTIFGKEFNFIQCLPFMIYMLFTAFCFGQILDKKASIGSISNTICSSEHDGLSGIVVLDRRDEI